LKKINKRNLYMAILTAIFIFIFSNYVIADQNVVISEVKYNVEVQDSKYIIEATFITKEPINEISLNIPQIINNIQIIKPKGQISRDNDYVTLKFKDKINEVQILTESEVVSEGKADIFLPVPKEGVLEQNKKIEFTLRLPKDETVDKVRPMGFILERQGEIYKSTLTTFIKSMSIEFSKGTKKDIGKIIVNLIVILVVISLFIYAFFEISKRKRRKK